MATGPAPAGSHPAPHPAREPDEQHDPRHHHDRLGCQARPLRVEQRSDPERAEPVVMLPPQVGEPEGQPGSPEDGEEEHPEHDRARDPPQPESRRPARQDPDERQEHYQGDGRAAEPEPRAPFSNADVRASTRPEKYRCRSRPETWSEGTLVLQSSHAHTPHVTPATSTVPAEPMRVAVLSDIHGNLHALEAVLAEVGAERPDEIWCLGDLVGYGPRPNECVDLIRESASIVLAGNHDLAVAGALDLAEFSGDAGAAAAWTRGVLDDERRVWLAGLSPTGTRPGAELYHASPRDPVWDYVLSEDVARRSLESTREPLVLVGHSHIPLVFVAEDGAFDGGLAPAGTEAEREHGRFLLNPGSIGQPRDGDPRAAWLLIDLDAGRAWFRRTAYEIAETQRELRTAGLPETLAARLALGL
jgi:predicted phosphodiesterase